MPFVAEGAWAVKGNTVGIVKGPLRSPDHRLYLALLPHLTTLERWSSRTWDSLKHDLVDQMLWAPKALQIGTSLLRMLPRLYQDATQEKPPVSGVGSV